MSVPPLSKLVRFLLIAAGLIIVFSVAWSFVDSAYSHFLSHIAGGLVSRGVTIQEYNGTITFLHREPYLGGYFDEKDWIDASAIQFGLLLAIALVAATPGLKIQRRILFSLIAAAITFVLQIISVAIMARTFNSLFFVIVSDVFPPVLWAVFSFKYWFAVPAAAQNPPPVAPPQPQKKKRN
jgi:hypothetical protein